MAVKEPTTYGDYWWSQQVEAQELNAEAMEKEMSAMASRLMDILEIRDVLPKNIAALFQEIEEPEGAFLGEVGGRFVSEVADGAVSRTVSPLFESIGYMSYMKWPTKKLTPEATATLYSRKRIDREFFLERLRMGGFEPYEAQFQYDAMMPYPSIPDIVLYARYHGDPNSPWSAAYEHFDIDPRDWPVWHWLSLQRLNTLQIQTLYKRGLIDETTANYRLAEAGWCGDDVHYVKQMSWVVPNAMLLVQGDLHQRIGTSEILRDISIADINPIYAQTYLDAILTKPSSQDLIAYELRKDPNLSNLPMMLERIGIHPDYTDIYKTLAYPIPPVADIITMAVREAFSPSIAAKFGQYADYPADFEKYAKMKGLSPEWSKRYWAAHWSLPSATQGFEMLHRGVIDFNELDILLRALDVMPFWRNKLTSIAYRRMTRVDIRRMYKIGVINQTEVLEAYLELGYNQRDAQRMTQFTVLWALPAHASITRADILTAYKRRMIDRSEASKLLADMGEALFHRDFMLDAVDYKKALEITEIKIKGIGNLYTEHIYDENKAIEELGKLDIPSDEIELLMEQWYYEIQGQTPRLWTNSQTLSFVKAGLITPDRAKVELKALGYDAEHIDIYMRSIE